MEEFDALVARAVKVATDVLEDKATPYEGAKELWGLSTAMWDLPEALLPFVGLASEWEDHPEHRAEYDDQIRIAMERFRRRFGK
jgi:hypothetical protein